MKTIAVIPCYNEATNVGAIIKEAKRHVDEVVVVAGGSKDKTVEIAEKAGATVLRQETRRGGRVGEATEMGVGWALSDKDCGVVVTIDGDGQHDPSEIPKVIKPILEGKADLVIGMRIMRLVKSDGMPRYRQFGNEVLTWLYNVGSKRKIVDSQSGFRVYSRQLLEAIEIEEDGFGFCSEALIKARALGFRIKEVPVSCIYFNKLRLNSTINPILQELKVIWATLKWRVKVELLRNGRKQL